LSKRRDRSKLKFILLIFILDSPLDISKYRLKQLADVPTTKQFDSLVSELLDANLIDLEKRPLPGKQEDTQGNYYLLTVKGHSFMEDTEKAMKGFLQITEEDLNQ